MEKSYKDFPLYVNDCMSSIIAQLCNVLQSNDRGAAAEFFRWYPFLLDLYEDYINLKEQHTQPATLPNPKTLNEESNKPLAPTISLFIPSNDLTLNMIEESPSCD